MDVAIASTLRLLVPPHSAWFLKRSKSPTLDGPIRRSASLRRPMQSLLSRLRNGLFLLTRVASRDQPGEIVLSCPEGRRLVRIDVSHQQGVCFSMRHLVAFSQDVHIESYINLSMAATGADRNFVYMAWCPRPDAAGAIVLETNGQPTTVESEASSFELKRVLAWDPRVEYRFGELPNIADILFMPLHIATRWNGGGVAVLLEADDSESQPLMRHVVRFVASLFLPSF